MDQVLAEIDPALGTTAVRAQGLQGLPVGALCPGLANLIALQNRLGLHDWVYKLAALLDPFRGDGVRIVGAADARLRDILEAVCSEEALDAVLEVGSRAQVAEVPGVGEPIEIDHRLAGSHALPDEFTTDESSTTSD